MTNKVLLINSQPLRTRTLADTMLENSLVILRTTLENAGIYATIWDDALNLKARDPKQTRIVKQIRRWYRIYFLLKQFHLEFLAGKTMKMIRSWQIQLDTILIQRRDRQIEDILDRIDDEKISIVGIKVWYGDAFRWTVELVRRIHSRFPRLLVVAGGPQVNVHQNAVLDFSDIDLLIYPEADAALVNIAQNYDSTLGRTIFCESLIQYPIENVSVRGGTYRPKLVPLNEKIIPHYGIDKNHKTLIHSLQEARGCDWNRCTFCSHPEIFAEFKPRAADQVLSEMDACLREGIGIFRFTASDTPLPIAVKIAEGILERGWSVQYSMFSRAMKNAEKRFDQIVDGFSLLARSGLRAIFVGGETGHDRVNLEIMNKGATATELIHTIRAVREASRRTGIPIDITLALIYPTPLIEGVSLQEVYEENLRLVETSRPDSVIVTPPGVFPRTDWWNNPQKFGFRMGADYQEKIMFYEYAAYKPTDLWETMEYSLNEMDMTSLLAQTARLRNAITAMNIQTEVTDEYLLMARAADFHGTKGLEKFKQESLLDILSTDNEFSHQIYQRLNSKSQALAKKSLEAMT